MFRHPLTSYNREKTQKNKQFLRSKLERPDLEESSAYTELPINKTLLTEAVWAKPTKINGRAMAIY